MQSQDIIAAIATPPGIGGVGIIRISGSNLSPLLLPITGIEPKPRVIHFARFKDQNGDVIDEGLVLFFPAPNSFTGEDVIELQGHGGPVVMDMLLNRVLECGARMAHAGEFSQRAFTNGKLDLAQAEAISDLIESGTAAAARLAVRSLEGHFSKRIHELVDGLIHLRMYVEAAIDFPEEEIDFLADGKVANNLQEISERFLQTQESAKLGRVLRDGMTLVIAGLPNAGKSSLLNVLAGRESAIVTEIPGTTRDLLREQIQIDGMPLHLIDTAGLRDSRDVVEQEGIRRAKQEMEKADRVLWIVDGAVSDQCKTDSHDHLPKNVPITYIKNKIDKSSEVAGITQRDDQIEIALSAKTGDGIPLLRQHLKECMGYSSNQEGEFIARRRHLDALRRAGDFLQNGEHEFLSTGSGELLAEDLRQAQMALSEITGEYSSDDLLGEIFSSFCIGK